MTGILKLLPIAAIGYFGYANSDVIKRNFDIINNVQTEATSSIEMQQICDAVVQEYITSNTIPLNNFPDFLEANMREVDGKKKRDFSRDLWGTQFRIARAEGGFEIQSAGPDKTWGTRDDINVARNLKQYGGVGEPGVTTVTPAPPEAHTQTPPDSTPAPLPPPTAVPVPAPAPSDPPAPAPAPAPEKKPYQWKRS